MGKKITMEEIESEFNSRGYTLVQGQSYKNGKDILKYICKKHGMQSIRYDNLKQKHGCRECSKDAKIGSGNPNWKGGITNLSIYLRLQLSFWVQQQLQRVNYTCELTGKHGTLNVHHMYSFKNILRDTMKELGMDIKLSVSDYTEEELQIITVNFIKNNDLYANPKVLLETVHKEFHSFCGGSGRNDTTQELWDSFVLQRESEGEFN